MFDAHRLKLQTVIGVPCRVAASVLARVWSLPAPRCAHAPMNAVDSANESREHALSGKLRIFPIVYHKLKLCPAEVSLASNFSASVLVTQPDVA